MTPKFTHSRITLRGFRPMTYRRIAHAYGLTVAELKQIERHLAQMRYDNAQAVSR